MTPEARNSLRLTRSGVEACAGEEAKRKEGEPGGEKTEKTELEGGLQRLGFDGKRVGGKSEKGKDASALWKVPQAHAHAGSEPAKAQGG
eukprot:1240625-Rhodomonas_salina.6